jgi:outer membrane immunogenic protein
MKHLLLATTALAVVAIASAASAADLGTRAPVYTKAPVYAPVSNWTGLYIGGNVGYGWGNGNTDAAFPTISSIPTGSVDSNGNGVIGGGQIGYNWQVGSLVTGLEADIQGSGINGTGNLSGFTFAASPIGPTVFSSTSKLSWFGTVRGRLGVSLAPTLLLYGTGGLAYGNLSNSASTLVDNIFQDVWPASISQTKTGWAAGAGAEWMFAPGWSAKLEYLHLDLGSASATTSDQAAIPLAAALTTTYAWHNRFDTVRFGVNYHFN